MSLSINSLVTISVNWTEFKEIYVKKIFQIQYDDDGGGDKYTIFAFDGPIVYLCNIWKNNIPEYISNYTQQQNDLDKEDFENNFKENANKPLVKLTNSGIGGNAPSKGLGGFTPDPKNNPYQPDPDEIVSLYVDGEGSLITRGSVLTDEGSLRDDFVGNSLETELTGTLTFTNGSNKVIGINTLFTKEVNRDSYIKLINDGIDCWVNVVRAPNDNSLLLEEPYQGSSGDGYAHQTKWISEKNGNDNSISLGNSKIKISSGVESNSYIHIHKFGDYLPIVSIWQLSVSQRIQNQLIHFGLKDNYQNPSMYCDVLLDGYDDTIIKFRSAWNNDEQLSLITLPSGFNTSQSLRYKIDVSQEYCSLSINGVFIISHENHIPDPYSDLNLCAGIINDGYISSNTDLEIDTVYFNNTNQVQILSSFSSPIPIVIKEDQHSIIGRINTSSTTSDQVILSYVVPQNKIFYLIGYKIDAPITSYATPIKIGINDICGQISSNCLVDNNIFRYFNMDPGTSTGEIDFGSNPRKLGVGGDVVKITVTPSTSLSSPWIASVDFVLR